MARFELNDHGVVVIIGSGAGGGTLAHELTRRGIKVVLLEAGKRQSLASFLTETRAKHSGSSPGSDPRTRAAPGTGQRLPTLPVLDCQTVGGTTVHWTGATPRMQPWEVRAAAHMAMSPGPRSSTGRSTTRS